MTVLGQLSVRGATLALRRATAEDVPSIVDLLAADQLGTTREDVTADEDLQLYLNAFDVIDADPAHLLLVATEGGQVLATMQLTLLPGLARRGALRAQIEAVRVRHDYRSRGLGAVLFEWAIEEARRRNCALVQLTTDKSRADAPASTNGSGSSPHTRGSSWNCSASGSLTGDAETGMIVA